MKTTRDRAAELAIRLAELQTMALAFADAQRAQPFRADQFIWRSKDLAVAAASYALALRGVS